VLIPFWKQEADLLENAGVKIGLEMHPGFCVYNSRTLMRLRGECGKSIGANFDPSHLFWQGMDPIAVVREIKDAIHHVHAKDMKMYPPSIVNGVLDTVPYSNEWERSWIFRTVGYGHDLLWWKDLCSNLRLVGYDYVLSIEHEDSLMSQSEGLSRAVETLKQAVMKEGPGEMTWA
ncbi:MAG TPA: sugar phosphate isomerase/epimerase, partial [Candidatus Lokiarchaeia archaeon]|nr:sugar phosphate isomerase/epimerase [Candidatus Lokiarchaeia archaeon]